jgi:hypothetical protein
VEAAEGHYRPNPLPCLLLPPVSLSARRRFGRTAARSLARQPSDRNLLSQALKGTDESAFTFSGPGEVPDTEAGAVTRPE